MSQHTKKPRIDARGRIYWSSRSQATKHLYMIVAYGSTEANCKLTLAKHYRVPARKVKMMLKALEAYRKTPHGGHNFIWDLIGQPATPFTYFKN